MTVSTSLARVQYDTNGTTGPWTVSFRFLADEDLAVIYTDSSGNETTLVLNTDYTVTGAGDPTGGTVTTTTAYAAGGYVTVLRDMDYTQEVDYTDTDSFPAETHEEALDRLTMLVQQVKEVTDRALVFAPSDTDGSTLPAASERASQMLGFDSLGRVTLSVPADGTAAALALDLANASSAVKGAGMIGYDVDLAYADRTIGGDLNKFGRTLQGADPTGVADSTSALKALFDLCIPNGYVAVLPPGTYKVTGKIANDANIAAGSLHIYCSGDVTIEVDASTTAFTTLLSCYTTAINNSSISGGRLTLNLNSKCSNGIYLRHAGGDGGSVDWGPITVNDAKNNTASDTSENQGVLVYGRYTSIVMRQPIVDTVERTDTAGKCVGISVSEFVGSCIIIDAQVSNVLTPGTTDADGIKVIALQGAGVYNKRAGSMTLISPTLTDNEGRSIKLMVSESVIVNPKIHRKSVVAVTGLMDIDYQIGGVHELIAPFFEYLKNGGTDPINVQWHPVSWQQQCIDATNSLKIRGGVTRTETAHWGPVSVVVGASSLGGDVDVDGWEYVSLSGLGASVTRALVEIDAGQVQAATATHISARNMRGNFSGAVVLGYTGASAANTSKLSFDLRHNENTGADSATSTVLGKLSGATTINQVGAFSLRDNAGFADLLGSGGWVFDALTLKPGCEFTYVRASSTFTNGPVTTGTYPRVECLGSISNGKRCVRITEDTGATLKFYYLQDGVTWRTN